MTALAQDRDTPFKFKQRKVVLDAAAAAIIYNGSLVAVNAAGYAVPASDTAGLKVIGRAEERVDNTSGANGDLSVVVSTGVFKLDNSGSNSIVQADVGADVFVLDDQTVVKTAGASESIVAGQCEELDSDGGIWVRVNL